MSPIPTTRFVPSLISVVIPACNESGVIGEVVGRVFEAVATMGIPCEVLVVNDGSTDGTAEEASAAGATVISHPYNIGNGAAVKSGLRAATGDVIVMLDGDGQHPPEDIPRLVELIGPYDMAVGARTSSYKGTAHRKLGNTIYNMFASYVCARKIPDLTSGFRAIKREIVNEFIYILPNTFSYPTTLTLSLLKSGYSVAHVPVEMRPRPKHSKSKINIFRDGSRFFLILFKIATLFSPLKIFLPVSGFTFLLGLFYGLYRVYGLERGYGPTSSFLMVVSVLMFLIGLVSEQIAQQRYEIVSIAHLLTSRQPGGAPSAPRKSGE